jgi:hypothetical protein
MALQVSWRGIERDLPGQDNFLGKGNQGKRPGKARIVPSQGKAFAKTMHVPWQRKTSVLARHFRWQGKFPCNTR